LFIDLWTTYSIHQFLLHLCAPLLSHTHAHAHAHEHGRTSSHHVVILAASVNTTLEYVEDMVVIPDTDPDLELRLSPPQHALLRLSNELPLVGRPLSRSWRALRRASRIACQEKDRDTTTWSEENWSVECAQIAWLFNLSCQGG
jgi:hypothetical protein